MRILASLALIVFAGGVAADDPPAGRLRSRVLAFSGDGRYLLAVSAANEDLERPLAPPSKYAKPPALVSVWELPAGKRVYHREEPLGIAAAVISPDGRRLALSRYGADIQIIDVATGRVVRELPAYGVTALAAAFFGDGKRLPSSNDDDVIRIWNVDDGTVITPFAKKYPGTANGHDIAVSGDGKTLAFLHEATVALVDLAAGKELQVFESDGTQWAGLHSFRTEWSRVHFTAGDRYVVMRSLIGTLAIRERATGKWVFWNESDRWDRDVAVSRDGKWIALSGQTARVLSVNLSSADETLVQDVRRLAENWDDDTIVVRDRASRDIVAMGIPALDELRRLEKESPSAEARLRARLAREAIRSPAPAFLMRHPESAVDRVAIAPDARTLATGGADGIVRLWELAGERPILVLRQLPVAFEIPWREP